MEAEAITLRMPTRSREEATFDEPVEPTIESRDDKPSSNSHTANGAISTREQTRVTGVPEDHAQHGWIKRWTRLWSFGMETDRAHEVWLWSVKKTRSIHKVNPTK